MNVKLLHITLSLILSIVFASQLKAQQETVLEQIDRTGLLSIGIREDAVPFGYRDLNGNLSGICLDLIALLRQELTEKLNKKALAIKLYQSTLLNRFELVNDKVVNLECGPNTIRTISDYEIQFSRPFFISGTQFLIKQENQNRVNPNGNLDGLKIGILVNTSTQAFLTAKYPAAEFVEFQGTTGRYRGVQALQGGQIDAFASDGILLIGEATLQGLSLESNYTLVPKLPLNCENYGLILPGNDPQWRSFVDSVIVQAREKGLFRRWFGVVLPEIQETINFCRSNQFNAPG